MADSARPASRAPWRGRARRPGRRAGRSRIVLLVLLPLAIVGVLGLLFVTVLSHRVAARFEARELESPTRIYGRVVTLRPGLLMPSREIGERLKRLGYRTVRTEPARPGEYREGRWLEIRMRGFDAPFGEVRPRAIGIRHSGERIASIRDAETGRDVSEALLEPEVLTTLYGPIHEDRTVLDLAEFPPVLLDAVLTAEDRGFYRHSGLDPFGMVRATFANVKNRAIVQGGSTVTQQLAKNLFFDQRKTLWRKINEAVVALILERRYEKDRLLQAYLNEIYLGQRGSVSIRGFAQAARFYFGKDVRNLDLAEAATLAGLIRAPGVYNPFVHPDRAVERRNQVLVAMEETGLITAEQSASASEVPLKVRRDAPDLTPGRGVSYLADYVRQMIGEESSPDFTRAGMRVFMTIDPTLQRLAEQTLTNGLQRLERGYRHLRRKEGAPLQGAMVVLDPRDGSVLAMVGGRDYATSQFNRITQARRQPGSLFKPFVYLAGYMQARENRSSEPTFTPATRLEDEPLEMRVAGKLWAPANYDNTFRGPVTAQKALEESLNVPTVRAAQMVGLEAVVAAARDAGIESSLKPYPSLALGAQEVTPLEMASAYATLANGGIRSTPAIVEAVLDSRGSSITARERRSERSIPASAAYLVTVGLQGAVDRGTAASARALGFTGTAAGKTGTTDDYRDSWFVGYTPDLVALVWIGFDDGATTRLAGAVAALPIWVDFMRQSGASTQDPFEEPEGILWEEIDPVSGLRARWSCPDSRWMAFLDGTEPLDRCDLHGFFRRWFTSRDASVD